ncbi:hypothetical protein AGLY_013396 [Aphis glycines]|uniref:Transmembrane protein n=1 Tax=Aphis glycines TaxID=307491 RepID=A0A6G0T667_APHGL|nr:hypothetical protein AGLY_013396 [Aphis glycines]
MSAAITTRTTNVCRKPEKLIIMLSLNDTSTTCVVYILHKSLHKWRKFCTTYLSQYESRSIEKCIIAPLVQIAHNYLNSPNSRIQCDCLCIVQVKRHKFSAVFQRIEKNHKNLTKTTKFIHHKFLTNRFFILFFLYTRLNFQKFSIKNFKKNLIQGFFVLTSYCIIIQKIFENFTTIYRLLKYSFFLYKYRYNFLAKSKYLEIEQKVTSTELISAYFI